MSLFDYQVSKTVSLMDYPFYALIMAAMRDADTNNTEKLQVGWPEVWMEFEARYHAPAGLLPGEQEALESLDAEAHDATSS